MATETQVAEASAEPQVTLADILPPFVDAPMHADRVYPEDLEALRGFYNAYHHPDYLLGNRAAFEERSVDAMRQRAMTRSLAGRMIALPFSLALRTHESIRKYGGNTAIVEAQVDETVAAFTQSRSAFSLGYDVSPEKSKQWLVEERTQAAVLGALTMAIISDTEPKLLKAAETIVNDKELLDRKARRAIKLLKDSRGLLL